MLHAPALILTGLGQPPILDEIKLTAPERSEVLVQMMASGLCHTDISYLRDARVTPVLLGHEGAGIVEAIGEDVLGVAVGDHVVINWQAKCNRCRRCIAGRQDLCENIQGTLSPRTFWRDKPLPVMLNAGTFCPYVIVPQGGAVPIRRDMPFEKAAMLGCAVATGVGASLYTAQVSFGDSVVVIGAGGVGLNVLQGARLAQASQIIAIDLSDTKLKLAQKYGATHMINSNDDVLTIVKQLTNGRGVDHVFEVVGIPDLMLKGIEMLARGGILTLVGATARDATLPFFPRRFMSQQQKIQGCIYGNIRPQRDLPLFADWYMGGNLLLDELHTTTVTLEELPQVFATLQQDRGIRPIITF